MTRNGSRVALTVVSSGELQEIQTILGVRFQHTGFLKTAFTHRSFLNEVHIGGLEHYERMEYLGDSVLDLVVKEHLYRSYPTEPEGRLTQFHAAVVNNKFLGDLASQLGFDAYVRMAWGQRCEWNANPRVRRYILGCVFEAVIGAIYLDRGIGTVQIVLGDILFPKLKEIVRDGLYKDPKSTLQEYSQSKMGNQTPEYVVVSESGPDHSKYFRMAACIGGVNIAEGEGPSKAEAEADAASRALAQLYFSV